MKKSNVLFNLMMVLAVAFMVPQRAKAGDPSWTVNPASFQYNMTMMAIVNIECADALSAGNRIGVFVGSECRGTAVTNQVIGGKYIASLFIYSNVVNGETLTFKIYNAQTDAVSDAKGEVMFQQNASYGTAGSPFIVYNKFPCYFTKEVLPVCNYLSPNGDGKNDYFFIDDVASYSDYTLTIYNEFGLQIFEKENNYSNDWDGTYDGKTLPTGAYYYSFKNGSKEYKGIINLVNPN